MKHMPKITKSISMSLLLVMLVFACGKKTEKVEESSEAPVEEVSKGPFFKLSLAQWSLHKQIQAGEMSPMDFAQKASELGFEGIEYVSQLYENELAKGDDPVAAMETMLMTLKEKSEMYKVQNVLIMVDHEGDMAVLDDQERAKTVENHKKWVDAAAYLGCHSIRVNAQGEGNSRAHGREMGSSPR